MLKKLRLHNFKTYLNAEIDLKSRHLVIGCNNSGKTNLCSAMRFLAAVARVDLVSAAGLVEGGLGELTNRVLDSNRIELECTSALEFESQDLEFTYTLALRVEASRRRSQMGELTLAIEKEQLRVRGLGASDVVLLDNDGEEAVMLHEEAYLDQRLTSPVKTRAPRDATMLSRLYELDTNRRAILFRTHLAGVSYFAISPFAIRYHWKDVTSADQTLSVSGHSLANALFHMKNWDERRYRRVVDFVRENVEPDLEAINFIPAPDQPPVPMVDLRHRPRSSWFGLSDGTLRLLAIAYTVEMSDAAAQAGYSPTVIIEEPENGIYPGLLRKLFDHIDGHSPRAQYIFTSHSPYFINLFDASREAVSYLKRNKERTEIAMPPPIKQDDPDREMLAEEYVLELLGK